MPFFPSLPEDAGVRALWDTFNPKAREALEPGGTILVVDYMLKDEKTGPLDPAFVNLFGIREGRYLGRVNTGAEWCKFLADAGFVDAEASWFTPHQLGMITARNPS